MPHFIIGIWPWHWSTVRDTGATIYEECPCGRRRIRQAKDGFQPIDRGWLETGEWTKRPPVPSRYWAK